MKNGPRKCVGSIVASQGLVSPGDVTDGVIVNFEININLLIN